MVGDGSLMIQCSNLLNLLIPEYRCWLDFLLLPFLKLVAGLLFNRNFLINLLAVFSHLLISLSCQRLIFSIFVENHFRFEVGRLYDKVKYFDTKSNRDSLTGAEF